MKKILFVCTGNTCRSPMAEALFNKKASEAGLDMLAESAGIFADGSELSAGADYALKDLGISDFYHTSRCVDKKLLSEAWVIIGITLRHAEKLICEFPEYSNKIFVFPRDIPDPFGEDIAVYKETLGMISDGVDTVIKELTGK